VANQVEHAAALARLEVMPAAILDVDRQ